MNLKDMQKPQTPTAFEADAEAPPETKIVTGLDAEDIRVLKGLEGVILLGFDEKTRRVSISSAASHKDAKMRDIMIVTANTVFRDLMERVKNQKYQVFP